MEFSVIHTDNPWISSWKNCKQIRVRVRNYSWKEKDISKSEVFLCKATLHPVNYVIVTQQWWKQGWKHSEWNSTQIRESALECKTKASPLWANESNTAKCKLESFHIWELQPKHENVCKDSCTNKITTIPRFFSWNDKSLLNNLKPETA